MRRHYSFEEKKEIVLEIIQADNKKEACERVGISRANFYRWRVSVAEAIRSHSKHGCEKSRRPEHLARSTPTEIREKIISMALSRKYKSANAIAKALADERIIHPGTVIKILESAGLYGVVEVKDLKGRKKKRSGLILPD